MMGNFTFSTICKILCSCSVVSYMQGFLHFFGLAYVHLFVVWMHTNSWWFFSTLCKKVWVEELLDEKVKELYIKVAFINIVYVTWNNYRLKSEEKKGLWRSFCRN